MTATLQPRAMAGAPDPGHGAEPTPAGRPVAAPDADRPAGPQS